MKSDSNWIGLRGAKWGIGFYSILQFDTIMEYQSLFETAWCVKFSHGKTFLNGSQTLCNVPNVHLYKFTLIGNWTSQKLYVPRKLNPNSKSRPTLSLYLGKALFVILYPSQEHRGMRLNLGFESLFQLRLESFHKFKIWKFIALKLGAT